MESMRALRRHSAFHSASHATLPRITPSQWGAILTIEELGESTVKDVADALGITSSAATQLINGLVDNGYVLRTASKKDRRTVLLKLSKKTKVHVAQMKKQLVRKFLKLFEVLNEKEFSQYLALNKKIAERFSKK